MLDGIIFLTLPQVCQSDCVKAFQLRAPVGACEGVQDINESFGSSSCSERCSRLPGTG